MRLDIRTRRERFQEARNYSVYYGQGNGHKLSRYDIAIVEPSAQSVDDIRVMKESNTLIIAYVTVMELGSFHSMYSMLDEDDFLKVNGKRVYKEAFDTYILNLQSKRWQGLLHHHVGNLLLNEGYDGIFMDTIGDVEGYFLPPVERNIQINQATHIVKRFRESFQNHLIVQNNGLEQLCVKTAPYLDGICWENPPFSQKESEDWCYNVLDRVIRMKREHSVKALFLNDQHEIKLRPSAGIISQSIADKHEFLYYEAQEHYMTLL